jgi:peptidoglycan/LPS O-acetylase OafA/YrhL
VYLFHQPVSGLMHAAIFSRPPHVDGPASALVTLAALAATLALAALTLRFIERPAIAFGRRFTYSAASLRMRPA